MSMWKVSCGVWNKNIRHIGLLCWYLVGTFRIVGKPFKQAFTIHCSVRKFGQSYMLQATVRYVNFFWYQYAKTSTITCNGTVVLAGLVHYDE